MRNLMKWLWAALATSFALAVTMPMAAVAQPFPADTRLVVPGGTTNTTKILPGATAIFEVRIDAPAVSTIGTTYRLEQTNPLLPTGLFSITGRSIVGSPYNDPSFGATDAQATAAPGNLLDPDNDVNLGKQTVGRVPIPPAINILATTITLTSNPLTPLGTYRIQPTVGSTTTSPPPVGTDWPMNFAFFDIVVGQTLTVTKSGGGTGTVAASSGAITCGATCSDIYPGTTIMLTANAAPDSMFTGWSESGCSGTGTCSVTVNAARTVNANFDLIPSGPQTATVIEYYHQSFDHYFITHIANEIAILDAGVTIKGWVRTGQSFAVYTAASADTSPVCRFYIPPAKGDSHFYGRGTVECIATGQKNPSFINEDPQFFHVVLPAAGVCPPGTREVYRVFSNRLDANHRYMIDRAIRDQMVASGWLAEGDGPNIVVMCVPAVSS